LSDPLVAFDISAIKLPANDSFTPPIVTENVSAGVVAEVLELFLQDPKAKVANAIKSNVFFMIIVLKFE